MSIIRTRPLDLVGQLEALASGVRVGRIRGHELARLETAVTSAVGRSERNSAIRRLGELLDPSGFARPWTLAGEVADRLDHFEASPAWREIATGGRRPRSTFETVAALVLGCPGPRDRRRLYDIIRDRDN